MKIEHIVFFVLLLPLLVLAQDNSDSIEAAKLGVIEKMYKGGADHYRQQLSARGLSDEEADDILFEAIDAYALKLKRAPCKKALGDKLGVLIGATAETSPYV